MAEAADDLPLVRFNDVTASYDEQRDEIDSAVADVIKRGDFINGRDVRVFEREFAAYCGTAAAVGTSSGTSALHLALSAAGIGPGDEVITTPMTFIATAEAITHSGARPVFADIDPETLNLSPEAAEAAICERTRAILFVHLHGNPSGVEEMKQLCDRRGLILIEDCAQAHGAGFLRGSETGEGCRVGGFGAAGCFSFFPAKNLGAFGDAGALVTNDPQLAEAARQLANHGREEKYRHLVEGYNYRLDTLQAAVLRVKLQRLNDQVARRNALAELYRERLSQLPLRLQRSGTGVRHALHLFVVETEHRDELQGFLGRRRIETGIHYPIPLHLQPAYEHFGWAPGSFPVAEQVARETLSLPIYPQMPPADALRVCEAVQEFFSGCAQN